MKSIRLATALASFVITCCLVRLATFNAKQLQLAVPRFAEEVIISGESSLVLPEDKSSSFKSGRISSKNRKCYDVDIDWSMKVTPKYKLDPTKFLVPTLINGPNNQMMGFQQSVLLSLLLNRTLVLPVFYHHQIDRFFRAIVPAEYRLNIQRLREYISVIPLQRAVKLCNYNFDAIFAGRHFNMYRKGTIEIARFSLETGFQGVDFVDDVGKGEIAELKRYLYSDKGYHVKERFRKRQWWPRNKTDESWTFNIVKTDRHRHIPIFTKDRDSSDITEIRSIYHTNARCALHLFPFRQYSFRKPNDVLLEDIRNVDILRITREDGWKLNSEIILNTPAPDAIGAWSKRFQDTYLCNSKNQYISMHWRFDNEDFFDYICAKESRKEFCDNVKRATNVTAISKALLTQVIDLGRSYQIRIGAVYIAAPVTLNHLIQEILSMITNVKFVRETLPSKVPIPKVFSSHHLKEFLLKNYKDCAMAKPDQLSDTISQVEMDICAQSYAFMWSRQSTWSDNVKRRRFLHGKSRNTDHSILDIVLEMMNNSSRSPRLQNT